MENYLIALAGYAVVFTIAQFVSRKKSNKQVQLSADYTIAAHKNNAQNVDERIETKSVA